MSEVKFYSLWLSLICILLFFIQLFSSKFTDSFMLTENALRMPWQFLTAIFLHGSLLHLIYNLFALALFGSILEKIIGSKKFLFLFFSAGIFANLVSFPFYPNALGASGAIMAILGVLAILRPMMSVFVFGMIVPMFIAAIIWVAGAVLGIFGLGDQGIGHLAHLSGIIFGVLYGLFLRATHKKPLKISENKVYITEEEIRDWEKSHLDR